MTSFVPTASSSSTPIMKHESEFKKMVVEVLDQTHPFVYTPSDRIALGIPDIIVGSNGRCVAFELKIRHEISFLPGEQTTVLSRMVTGGWIANALFGDPAIPADKQRLPVAMYMMHLFTDPVGVLTKRNVYHQARLFKTAMATSLVRARQKIFTFWPDGRIECAIITSATPMTFKIDPEELEKNLMKL
jgi:hypothetical protein